MDMSEAYKNAVKDHAPQADVVYDRFQLVGLLLDAIDEVRRMEVRKLARAYELRCDFEDLWELEDEEEAREFLTNRTTAGLLSRHEPLRRFASTVRKRIDGILGFFRWWGTTSGLVEGINSEIQLAIHRAFGFHSADARVWPWSTSAAAGS